MAESLFPETVGPQWRWGRQSTTLFAVSALVLAGINIGTYPYIPGSAIGFHVGIMLATFAGAWAYSRSGYRTSEKWILFIMFTLTVLTSRAFINVAGIGTPRSMGNIGPFAVQQIWVGGIHLHHYMLGFLLMALAVAGTIWGDRSRLQTAAFLGVGLAFTVDETGIILAGHTYHSPVSYVAVAGIHIALLALLWTSKGS